MEPAANSHDMNGQLSDLVEHHRVMLEDAEKGDWEKVIKDDLLRRNKLRALYSSTEVHNLPDISSATQEMLLINQKLEKLALTAKQEVSTAAVSINKGRRAVGFYERHVR